MEKKSVTWREKKFQKESMKDWCKLKDGEEKHWNISNVGRINKIKLDVWLIVLGTKQAIPVKHKQA